MKLPIDKILSPTIQYPINSALDFLKMIDKLEEDEDINTVYHNLELTDELRFELEK